MSIGENIKKLRTQSGKTQRDIADLLNVDRRTYAKWEDETAEVKSSLVPNLAEIFGVDIADLYNNKKAIEIKDSFRENKNSINNAIVILTDKDLTEKFLNLFEQTITNKEKK